MNNLNLSSVFQLTDAVKIKQYDNGLEDKGLRDRVKLIRKGQDKKYPGVDRTKKVTYVLKKLMPRPSRH